MSNSSSWKALLISPNTKMSAELLPILSQQVPFLQVFDTQTYPDRRELAQAMKAQPCNVCFLDVSSNPGKALQVISDLHAIDAGVRVFSLLQANDPDLILRCLRQGAAEFVTQPFTADQIGPVIEKHIRQDTGGGGLKGKVYCVMPAKGACGASTVAANLAFQIRKRGIKKVLLADLDPLTGTISFILKLKSQYSFLDVLSRASILDDDLWKGMVSHSQGVDVLLPPEHLLDGISDLKDTGAIIQYARGAYDAVILDTAGAYGDWNLNMARLCDELLLVTTNELPALQAAQRALAYLEANQVARAKIRVVVNRYARDVGLSREVIGQALHTEVLQVISDDFEAVQKALLEGKPILGGTNFGKALSALAEQLVGKEKAKEPEPKKTAGLTGWKALFSRTSS